MDDSASAVQRFVFSVLKIRKYIFITKIMIIIIMLSVGLNYYQLIAHAFQKEDLTNQIVAQAALSEEYQSAINPMLDLVRDYNDGHSQIKPTSDFYANIPTLLNATIVHIHGKLIELPPKETADGKTHFKYEIEYSITLVPYVLSAFLAIEGCLFLFFIFVTFSRKDFQERKFENTVIDHYYEGLIEPNQYYNNIKYDIENLKNILKKFNSFYHLLNQRHNKRTGIVINDEYDVQDLLHSILTLFFTDVQRESSVPYNAGSNSRIDFLIRDENIGIEVKMTRKGLKDKELGEQIIIDMHRYSSHQNCKDVLFFIYDPQHYIMNIDGLRNDIKKENSKLTPHLVIVPER